MKVPPAESAEALEAEARQTPGARRRHVLLDDAYVARSHVRILDREIVRLRRLLSAR